MKRMQFSVLSLLGAITLAGLGCAALVNASPVWAATIVSLTVLTLVTATLTAVYSPSSARAFCGGFAIVGWTYLLLTASALFDLEKHLFTGAANDVLYVTLNESPTTPGVNFVYAAPVPQYANAALNVVQPMPAPPLPLPSTYSVTTQVYSAQANSTKYTSFDRIGHSLWAILLATVGGVMARYLASNRRAMESSDA